MEYRNLGKAGVKVSRLCLGTAFRGHGEEATCIRVIERALDLGCTFVDCANSYGRGRSETIVGKALKDKRQGVVLTSKVWTPMADGPNDRGLSRFHIMREVEDTLQRLQTDYLDLYLLHNFDPETPMEETLRATDDLVRQGKTRYVGCSNLTGWQIVTGLWTSDARALAAFACIQNPYNLLMRDPMETDLIPVCRHYGLGIMTYSPLAVGLLTGRFRRGQLPPPNTPWSRRPDQFETQMTERADAVVQTLIDIAGKHNKTPAQVAIAWLLDQDDITAPILGPDLPEHVDEAFGALDIHLTPEDRTALDEISRKISQ